MNDGCHINVEPHNQSKLAERLLLNSAIGYGANVHPKNNDGEIEVAHGKPFLLSSRHYADPSNRYVSCRAPFFFHTENNNWEGIEIDLKAFYYLKRIVIQNRLDGF